MWQLSIRHVVLLCLALQSIGLATGKQELEQQQISVNQKREKRAAVITIDFGMLLRNLLLKSAQLSNAKANVTRTVANLKTTRRPTTTPAPPPPPPLPPQVRRRPIYAGPWRPYDYYYPYADYGETGPAPEAPPPKLRPIRPPAPAPAPALRRPPPPDYDYDYEPAPAAVPRQARPLPPPPPPPRAQPAPPSRPRRPVGQPQLPDGLIYQYAQPTDIYSRPSTDENGYGNENVNRGRAGDGDSGIGEYEEQIDADGEQPSVLPPIVVDDQATNQEVDNNYYSRASVFSQPDQRQPQQEDRETSINQFAQQQYY